MQKNWNHKPAVQINAALLMLLDQGSTNNRVGWCKLLNRMTYKHSESENSANAEMLTESDPGFEYGFPD